MVHFIHETDSYGDHPSFIIEDSHFILLFVLCNFFSGCLQDNFIPLVVNRSIRSTSVFIRILRCFLRRFFIHMLLGINSISTTSLSDKITCVGAFISQFILSEIWSGFKSLVSSITGNSSSEAPWYAKDRIFN